LKGSHTEIRSNVSSPQIEDQGEQKTARSERLEFGEGMFGVNTGFPATTLFSTPKQIEKGEQEIALAPLLNDAISLTNRGHSALLATRTYLIHIVEVVTARSFARASRF
jgi:hypothetical protein